MRPMNYRNRELDRQMEAAYSEGRTLRRALACLLLLVALAALFVFRAATTDPLWEVDASGRVETAK